MKRRGVLYRAVQAIGLAFCILTVIGWHRVFMAWGVMAVIVALIVIDLVPHRTHVEARQDAKVH